MISRFRHDPEEWKILPTVTGAPVSIEDLKAIPKKLFSSGVLCPALDPDRVLDGYLTAKKAGPVTAALGALGAHVVLESETCRFADFIGWTGEQLVPAQVSDLVLTEPAGRGEPGLEAFLKTLALLGETCGRDYACVYPAKFSGGEPGLESQPFVFRRSPYGVGHREGEGIVLKRKARLNPVINFEHPFIKELAALHASRPGFAAFLLLKSMLLYYEELHRPGVSNIGCNLTAKMELRLLKAALKLDAERGANG